MSMNYFMIISTFFPSNTTTALKNTTNNNNNNVTKHQAINSTTMNNCSDDDSMYSIGGIPALNKENYKQKLGDILLNQAIEILRELKFNKRCIKGNSNEGYKIINPRILEQLFTKAQALVAYVDAFVLEDSNDKVEYVKLLGDYEEKRGNDRNDYYDYLRYATGLFNTILTECKWKEFPNKITKSKQRRAIGLAIDAYNGLNDVLVQKTPSNHAVQANQHKKQK